MKHSPLGLASFIISILVGVGDFILILVAGYMQVNTPGGMSEESFEAVVIGLFLLACFGLCLIGVGLGIAGLFQNNHKKIFAILGTVFNLVIFICVAGLMVVGILVG